ncbi:MAG TPA: hypothetical protein VL461_13600 [Dictyobacter sp.]|jgi:hypothetical protein|nr:hypothetical protein [Dictyobacter sp.]
MKQIIQQFFAEAQRRREVKARRVEMIARNQRVIEDLEIELTNQLIEQTANEIIVRIKAAKHSQQ